MLCGLCAYPVQCTAPTP